MIEGMNKNETYIHTYIPVHRERERERERETHTHTKDMNEYKAKLIST